MNRNIIKYYLAYRFYQRNKQRLLPKGSSELIAEFNQLFDTRSITLFNHPELSILEITKHGGYKPDGCLKSLILTQTYQKKEFKKKFDESLSKVNNALVISCLNEENFNKLLACMKFLFFKCSTLPSFDPNTISVLYEIIILRAFLTTNTCLIDRVISELDQFTSYARPDYLMLYKLTSDPRFYIGDRVKVTELCVWDYINAAAGVEGKVEYLGRRLVAQAILLPQSTQEQLEKKRDELAVAAYWLADEPSWRTSLMVAAVDIEISENPLSAGWLVEGLSRHQEIINRYIVDQPEVAHFLFNKLDSSKISLETLEEIIADFDRLKTDIGFYLALDFIKDKFKVYFNVEHIDIYDKRRGALDVKSQVMERINSRVTRENRQEKRKKFFAKNLASDQCPILLTDYISFNADGIINLTIYDTVSEALLNQYLGTFGYRAYQKQGFVAWIEEHKTDMVELDKPCTKPELINGKYNKNWLKIFVNLKRLKDTGLLSNVSENWFIHKKLYCLLGLNSELFAPQYLYYIEAMDLSKISINDIDYINKHYDKFKNLPIEVIFLGRCLAQDERCNLYPKVLNSSMLAIFDQFTPANFLSLSYASLALTSDVFTDLDDLDQAEARMAIR